MDVLKHFSALIMVIYVWDVRIYIKIDKSCKNFRIKLKYILNV